MSKLKKILPPTLLICGLIGVGLDYADLVDNIWGNPVLVVSVALLVLSLPLAFVKEQAFSLWVKFASWWTPISLLVVLLVPMNQGGFLPSTVDKGIYSFILWSGFVLISIILLAYKSFSLRGK